MTEERQTPDRVEIGPRSVYRWAVFAALGFLTVALGAMAVYAVRRTIVLALVALFVAISLDPAVRWLTRHGVRRSIAVAAIFLVAFLSVAGLLAALMPPLISQATNLSADLPGYIDRVTEQSRALRDLGERFGLTGNLRELAAQLPARIGTSVVGFVRQLFGAVLTGLTIIVLSIYFMADLPRLKNSAPRLFPPSSRPRVRQTVEVVVDKVGAYMIGNILISLVAGVTTFLVLTLLGAPFALPLAVFVAITDLIPMIGATLGAVVAVFVTAVADNVWPTAALVAIFFIVYQQLENYLIAPRILRNTVDLPALAVLLAALVGGAVLGLIGALMAIPIAAVVKVLGSEKVRQMDAAEAAGMVDDSPTPEPD